MGTEMSSGADLFVVCKQCGSEVSPYITECPYCGSRLRRRAPKLPRASAPKRPRAALAADGAAAARPRPSAGARARSAGVRRSHSDRWALTRPYATITLVVLSCAAWIAGPRRTAAFGKMAIIGPLNGDWWRLFTAQFAYSAEGRAASPAFVIITTVAIFGWLLERRHGPFVVLILFFGASVTGALVALAVYELPVVDDRQRRRPGAAGAWAVPDLRAPRARAPTTRAICSAPAVIAALLLVLPFARPEASWLAGVVGGAFGLLVGFGLGPAAPAPGSEPPRAYDGRV